MTDPAELFGRDLHGYVIAKLLGSGGFGWVYQVRHRFLGDRALKVLYPWVAQDPSQRERFRREAITGDLLHHENIVPVYDMFEAEGLLCIVMMLVDPPITLASIVVNRRTLPLPTAASAVLQMAAALDHAHASGVIHRDVTPNNALIRPDGKVMLTDFGIAQLASHNQTVHSSHIAGTPAFMSPEQLSGVEVGRRSDVYQFALVIHHMVTGHVRAGPRAPMPPPPRLNSLLPTRIDAVLQHCFAWHAEDRAPTAGHLARAFAECAGPQPLAVAQVDLGQTALRAGAAEATPSSPTLDTAGTVPSFVPPPLDAAVPPAILQAKRAFPPGQAAKPSRRAWAPLPQVVRSRSIMVALAALLVAAISISGVMWWVATSRRPSDVSPRDSRSGTPTQGFGAVAATAAPTAIPTPIPTPVPSQPVVAATDLPTPLPPPTPASCVPAGGVDPWPLANGTLAQGFNPITPVVVIISGAIVGFASMDELNGAGYGGQPVIHVDSCLLSRMPRTPADGTLVQGIGPGGPLPVAVIVGGKVISFANPDELNSCGYGGQRIFNVPPRAFNGWLGTPANGSFVKAPDLSQIWTITNGRRVPVSQATGPLFLIPQRAIQLIPGG